MICLRRGVIISYDMGQEFVNEFGRFIKERRKSMTLSIAKLSKASGVSPSHITRIEAGERFPSARILRRLAEPLGLTAEELFRVAGYLSVTRNETLEIQKRRKIDPYVAEALAREPPEIQRAAVVILNILRRLSTRE